MKTSTLQSYLQFSKSQRLGLLVFFALLAVLQLGFYFFDSDRLKPETKPDENEWLSLQANIDTSATNRRHAKPKFYPFNPNFITDFKGYQLGMSVAEIDRLLEFRKTNRYVNSSQEFQKVTQVSDSLLAEISPYFKFPDWVKNKHKREFAAPSKEVKAIVKIDINSATQEDLKKVYGIGDGLSERILKEKEKLGGFVSMEQMGYVWGLSPEVVEKLNAGFKVAEIPNVRKVKINEATVKELMQFPYFRYALAKSIVTYRSMNGGIKGVEDLVKISEFPIDKVDIIALYLEF
jgi:DNA uptake protein ComE-like DNA-binding protein